MFVPLGLGRSQQLPAVPGHPLGVQPSGGVLDRKGGADGGGQDIPRGRLGGQERHKLLSYT